MTPEQWTDGLDLPKLMRYGTPGQARGLIATAIREAVRAEREACAATAEAIGRQGAGNVYSVCARLTADEIAAVIRGRGDL